LSALPRLTPPQRALLDFIRAYMAEHGYSPTLDEMVDSFNAPSKTHAHHLVGQLEAAGHLRRALRLARSIELLDGSVTLRRGISPGERWHNVTPVPADFAARLLSGANSSGARP
jgi:repressor LexA